MRKTQYVETWFCDLCGEQGPREIMNPVYGRNDSRSVCPHFGVDICLACQRRPVADLLGLLRERGNNH